MQQIPANMSLIQISVIISLLDGKCQDLNGASVHRKSAARTAE